MVVLCDCGVDCGVVEFKRGVAEVQFLALVVGGRAVGALLVVPDGDGD